MPKSDPALIEAVNSFKLAFMELKKASSNLDKLIQPKINGFKSAQDGVDLLAELPDHYRGIRRVYEVMDRLSTAPAVKISAPKP